MGQVRVEVDTAKAPRGNLAKEIKLRTNDPERPTEYLRLMATVVADMELHPTRLALSNVPEERRAARLLVRRTETAEGRLAIGRIETGKPYLAATARRVDAPEPFDARTTAGPGDWIVEVRLDGNAPWGVTREKLTFATGLTREPEGGVSVVVNMVAPLTIRPRSLTLRRSQPDQPYVGQVHAVVREDRVGEPVEATVSPDVFEVSLDRTDERRYRARVRWNGAADAPTRGRLTLTVGDHPVAVPIDVARD